MRKKTPAADTRPIVVLGPDEYESWKNDGTRRVVLRKAAVLRKLGVGQDTLDMKYRKDPSFPPGFQLVPGAHPVWLESDLDRWIESRANAAA